MATPIPQTRAEFDAMRYAMLSPSQRAQVDALRKHNERFKKSRLWMRLRKRLFAENPHCDNCGRTLQMTDSRQNLTYAHVVEQAERLSCGKCVKTVRSLYAAEREPESYVVVSLPEVEIVPAA